jgi:hypothetical protein
VKSLIFLVPIAVIVFLRLRGRARPAPVRPSRAFIYVAVALVGTALGVAGSLNLLLTPLGAALVPVMLVVGAVMGVLLTNSMTFYAGPDGKLWMKGGVIFIAIFLGLLAVRFGIRFAAVGSIGPGSGGFGQASVEPATPLSIVSADLLFLSVGLWLARAVALWRRHRAYVASLTQPAASRQPATSSWR